MKIQNHKLKNLKLSIKGTVLEFDGEGIVDVEDKIGQALLSLPNYNIVGTKKNQQGDLPNETKKEETKNTKEPVKETDAKEEKDLNNLSVADLKALADERGLDYDARVKKADLLKLLA